MSSCRCCSPPFIRRHALHTAPSVSVMWRRHSTLPGSARECRPAIAPARTRRHYRARASVRRRRSVGQATPPSHAATRTDARGRRLTPRGDAPLLVAGANLLPRAGAGLRGRGGGPARPDLPPPARPSVSVFMWSRRRETEGFVSASTTIVVVWRRASSCLDTRSPSSCCQTIKLTPAQPAQAVSIEIAEQCCPGCSAAAAATAAAATSTLLRRTIKTPSVPMPVLLFTCRAQLS